MDSLTQIVLGASVAEAAGGKQLGNKAALWGAIAGTIPDLDVFIRAFSEPIEGALLHRGFSHSIIFALIMGPALGWVIHRIYRQRYSLRRWQWVAFLAIITHPMLDMFTNYGTQFFWPFEWRVTFNSVFVIDPLYTVPFGLLLLAALYLKRENKWRSRLNYAGIIYSTAYLFWGVIVKMLILNTSPEYFKDYSIAENKTIVTPMPFTSFYWMIVAEDDSMHYVGYKSIFYPFNNNSIDTLKKNHDVLETLDWRGEDHLSTIKFLANDCYAVKRLGDSIEVYDMKFGLSSAFTWPKVTEPLRGYGLVIDNNIVNKTYIARPKAGWQNINFGKYINKIFKDDEVRGTLSFIDH